MLATIKRIAASTPRPAAVDPATAMQLGALVGGTAPAPPTGAGAWSDPGAAGSARDAGLLSLDEFIASLSGSYLMGLESDLAFFVMCEQIRDADRRIRSMMNEIRQIAAVRDAVSQHVDRLREFENKLRRASDDQDVDPEHCFRWDPGEHHIPVMDDFQDLRYRPRFDVDVEASRIEQTTTDAQIGSTAVGVSLYDVQREIKHWETQCQQLDSNREIKLIELNSSICKRANVIELLSNMEKKKHESQRAVISNLR